MPNTGFDAFSSLSKGARAALPFLTAAAASEDSTSEILRQAKDLGYSIRRQTGLDIIGALRENINAARSIRLTPESTPLNPDFYGTALYPTNRNYSYSVVVRAVNGETGETINQHMTVSSDDPLSVEQIQSKAATYAESGKYSSDMQVDSIDVVNALKSPLL